MGDPGDFGPLLRRYRRARGLTQHQLALSANISTSTIGNLENSRIGLPQQETLRLLIEALDLDEAQRARFLVAGRPPAVPLAASRNGRLPHFRTRFIGREQLRKTVAALLQIDQTPLLVTLTGPGGSGKTRLAVAVAGDLSSAYPDGVWFTDLAALTDPELVVSTVAATFGVRGEGDETPLTVLANALRSRHLLLVLDNCEHLAAACAPLALVLQHECPRVHLLATSRSRLDLSGELICHVPPLPLPADDADPAAPPTEAVRFFLDRVAQAAPAVAADPAAMPTIMAICRALGGLPLALELAAARVADLPVEEIAAALPDGIALLDGGARDFPPRHQSLRTTFDWSYGLLTPSARAVFQQLSVFAGSWTLAAARFVCTDAPVVPDALLAVIAELVASSLVMPVPGTHGRRYRLLEPVRQYAAAQLLAGGAATAVQRRHYDWCVARAARVTAPLHGGPALLGWLAEMGSERANLWAALHWAQTGDDEGGVTLAGLLWPYYLLRLGQRVGQQLLRTSLAIATTPSVARARALYGLGFLALFSDTRAAHASLLEAQALAQAVGGLELVAELHWPLAFTSMMANDIAGARAHLDAGWALLDDAAPVGLRSPFRMLNGFLALATGALEEGRRELGEAYVDALAADQPLYQCMILARLGGATLKLGQPQQALTEFAALRTAADKLDSALYRAIATLRQGAAHEWSGDLDAAAAAYAEGLQISITSGGGNLERASGLIGLGRIAIYRHQPDAALVPLQEAAPLLVQLGPHPLSSELAYRLGLALWQTGQRITGAAELARALNLFLAIPDKTPLAQCLESLATLAIEDRAAERAALWLGAATTLRRALGTPCPTVDKAVQDDIRATAAALLGADAFATAEQHGATQALADVVAAAKQWLQQGDAHIV